KSAACIHSRGHPVRAVTELIQVSPSPGHAPTTSTLRAWMEPPPTGRRFLGVPRPEPLVRHRQTVSHLRIGLFDLPIWNEPSDDGAYDVRPTALDPLDRTLPVRRARQLEDLGPLELRRGAQLPFDLIPVTQFLNGGSADDCYVLPTRR